MTIKKIIKKEQDKITAMLIGGKVSVKGLNRALDDIDDDIKNLDIDKVDKEIEEKRNLLGGQDKKKVGKLSDEILELNAKKDKYKEYLDLLDNKEKTEDALEKNALFWNDLNNCENEVTNLIEKYV